MKAYFEALLLLASSDAAEQTGNAATQIVERAVDLGRRIRAEPDLGRISPAFIGEAVRAGVYIYQRHLLSEQLKMNATLIEEQLLLQQAAMRMLADHIQSNEAAVRRQRHNWVTAGLSRSLDLDPSQWAETQATLLLIPETPYDTQPVIDASNRMVETWRRLVRRASGNLTEAELLEELTKLYEDRGRLQHTTSALGRLLSR